MNYSDRLNKQAKKYHNGEGELNGTPNYVMAIKFYEKAIELGNSSAMYARARMYRLGEGEPNGSPNFSKALRLIASHRGNAPEISDKRSYDPTLFSVQKKTAVVPNIEEKMILGKFD